MFQLNPRSPDSLDRDGQLRIPQWEQEAATMPFDHSHAPFESVTENYLRAMQACAESQWADAIVLFDGELETSPAYGLALGNKGQALLALDRFAEAEPFLRQALDVLGSKECPHAPSEIQFLRNLAEAVGRQGRWGESLALFERAATRADELLVRCPHERGAIKLQQAHVFNSGGNSYLHLRHWKSAVEQYENAREIFRDLGAGVHEGYAETLTNLALALTELEDFTPADFALKEALGVARASRDDDQVFRIKIAAIQMRSSIVPAVEWEHTLVEAIEWSQHCRQMSTAYLRCCIGAELSEEESTPDEGLRFIERARALEGAIPGNDPHIAMLRGTEAELLRQRKALDSAIIPVLIDGARRWYDRLGTPVVGIDFVAVTRSMHNHFRMLARHLNNLGRSREALAAFEAGRSLLHYLEVNSTFLSATLQRNPFEGAKDAVDDTTLRGAQSTLCAGECAVVLAVLPPELVAFVVWNDRVEVVAAPWPMTLPEGNALYEATEMIPHRLAEGVGSRSVPDQYHDFAARLLHAVGAARICGLTPYSVLHLVPWRAVLRAQGAAWNQLSFSTGFGFLLRAIIPPALKLAGISAVALGHGAAGSINLKEESHSFAEAFGLRGELAASCRAFDIRGALASRRIVHLSCHGKVVSTDDGRLTTFQVADGSGSTISVEMHEILPDTVSSPLVILSACESGVYEMQWGEFPMGAAPLILQRGAQRCIGSRFLLQATFAQEFFPLLARELASGRSVEEAFADCLGTAEASGRDLWRDLACLELLGGA